MPSLKSSSLNKQILVETFAVIVITAILVIQAASYVALIFQGEAQIEFGLGLWASLLGIGLIGFFVGGGTSISPLACGVDTPTLAVSTAMAANIAAQTIAKGYGGEGAAIHILMALTVSTILTGIIMLSLGFLRLGTALRFIPYAVVAGFLSATGLLTLSGGISVLLGKPVLTAIQMGGLGLQDIIRLSVAAGFTVTLLVLRRFISSPLMMPCVIAAFSIGIFAWTAWSGSTEWYLTGRTAYSIWNPVDIGNSGRINWTLIIGIMPDIFAVVIVTLISLVVKIATIESSRGVTADYDRELRMHGFGNLFAAPLGGISMGLHLSGSKVAVDFRVQTRWMAVGCSLLVLALLATGIDIVGRIRAPVLAGLLMFKGYGLLADGLRAPIRQRAWFELCVALAILVVCVVQGYIVGVLAGLVASCMIFAVDYGRVGIVRRHLTRAELSGAVTRAPEISTFLKKQGTAIHIYWLTGYIFFGSSEQLFRDVRLVIETPSDNPVRFVVLDFSGVTGADASARASLVKLKAFCARSQAGLVFSGLPGDLKPSFLRLGLLTADEDDFADFQRAVEWCEQQILADEEPKTEAEAESRLQRWLIVQLGQDAAVKLWPYLQHQTLGAGEILHEAGADAASMEFVARGVLDLSVGKPDGGHLVVRRMARETIVGEMGFFRSGRRSTRVSAQSNAVVYRLTRSALTELEARETAVAIELHKLIIRELSNRLDLANAEAAALR